MWQSDWFPKSGHKIMHLVSNHKIYHRGTLDRFWIAHISQVEQGYKSLFFLLGQIYHTFGALIRIGMYTDMEILGLEIISDLGVAPFEHHVTLNFYLQGLWRSV